MSAADLATVIGGVVAGLTGFMAGIKFLIKHYLSELKPNGGGSLNDRISRLEARVETIIRLLER